MFSITKAAYRERLVETATVSLRRTASAKFFFARLHSAADYVPKRSNSGLPGEWPQQFFRNVSAAIEGSPLARASSVKTKRLQVGTILRKRASFLGIAMRKAFPRNSLIRLEPRRDLNPCYRRERARIYWIP